MPTKSFGAFERPVNTLLSAIATREKQLTSTYNKSIRQYKRELISINSKLSTARKNVTSAKKRYDSAKTKCKQKKTAACTRQLKQAQIALTNANKKVKMLTQSKLTIKDRLSHLLMSHKKWLQRQKMMMKFEKTWQKQTNKKKTMRRKKQPVA